MGWGGVGAIRFLLWFVKIQEGKKKTTPSSCFPPPSWAETLCTEGQVEADVFAHLAVLKAPL